MLSRSGTSEAGRLRLRLALERATSAPDGAGGSTLVWQEITTLAAEMAPTQGSEREVGQGLVDLTLQRIVIRWREDIRAGDRFRLGGRLFRVRSIIDPDEDERFLVCTCEEEGRP